jgi:hypothetical protein
MPQIERGECAVCARVVRLTPFGRITRHDTALAPAAERVKHCPGSHQRPVFGSETAT